MNFNKNKKFNYIANIDGDNSAFDTYISSMNLQRYNISSKYGRTKNVIINIRLLSIYLKKNNINNCLILYTNYNEKNIFKQIETIIPDGNLCFCISKIIDNTKYKKIIIQGVPSGICDKEFNLKIGGHFQKFIKKLDIFSFEKSYFPINIGKIQNLHIISEIGNKNCCFYFIDQNFRFDCIYNAKKESKTLIIIINQSAVGYNVDNTMKFQRWSWCDDFNAITLCVNDPMLYISKELTAGWWIGTKSVDLIKLFIKHVNELAKKLNISNIIFYGSSAGGFTALQMAACCTYSKAIVDIPQINLNNYKQINQVKIAFEAGFGKNSFILENILKYKERINVLERMNKENNYPDVIYLQNINDTNHINDQFIPFVDNFKGGGNIIFMI